MEVPEVVNEAIDEWIRDGSLEDAIERLEVLSADLEVRITALREDIRARDAGAE